MYFSDTMMNFSFCLSSIPLKDMVIESYTLTYFAKMRMLCLIDCVFGVPSKEN